MSIARIMGHRVFSSSSSLLSSSAKNSLSSLYRFQSQSRRKGVRGGGGGIGAGLLLPSVLVVGLRAAQGVRIAFERVESGSVMEGRQLRSATRKAAAALGAGGDGGASGGGSGGGQVDVENERVDHVRRGGRGRKKKVQSKNGVGKDETVGAQKMPQKRVHHSSDEDAEGADYPQTKDHRETSKKSTNTRPSSTRTKHIQTEKDIKKTLKTDSSEITTPHPPPTKRSKKTYQGKPPSPFPHHHHPTPEEVKTVVDLLSTIHGIHTRPPVPPLPNLLVTGCGEVPSILDALIRTLLSASTSAANSNRAFKGLVDKFGVCDKRGSVDWEKVRKASLQEVYEAIKSGGLAKVKSARIKKILDQVWEEGQERRKKLLEKKDDSKEEDGEGGDDGDGGVFVATRKGGDGEKVVVKEKYHGHQIVPASTPAPDITTPATSSDTSSPSTPKTTDDDSGYESDTLSLDYLHLLPDDDCLAKLTSFDGIGFKTASCVMLFCMARDSFAVDTHVFRIARFLNWVPPDKATRETAFWHLDERVPDEYKYPLHQLFIKHGRSCRWCKAGGPLTWEDGVRAFLRHKVKEENGGKGEDGAGGKKVRKVENGKVIEEDEVLDEEKIVKEFPELKKCPIEHLVKRFHGASKGRGIKWEEDEDLEMRDQGKGKGDEKAVKVEKSGDAAAGDDDDDVKMEVAMDEVDGVKGGNRRRAIKQEA